MNDFDLYQEQCTYTAIYDDVDNNIFYPTLGLVGEAGEVANKIKRLMRGEEIDNKDIEKELGDVMWYVALVAHEAGLKLSDIVDKNVKKLQDRKLRNKLQGSGDDR